MLSDLKKCIALIDPRTTVRAGLIGLLMLVAAVLEAFGLGLVYVFVRALLDPASAEGIPLAGSYLAELSAGEDVVAITYIVSALLFVYLLKNGMLICLYFAQSAFIVTNEARLAERLLNFYLRGAYHLHLARNSADLIRNVTGSVSTIFSAVMTSYLNLATELVVITAVGAVLISLEPAFTVGSIVVLGSAVGGFFWFSRTHVQRWGRNEQLYQGAILKALQQGFHSIKEVKILGCEESIRESFNVPRMALARTRIKFAVMTQAPRLWTETVVITAILLSVLGVLFSGGQIEDIVSILALFAAATFRLLPSMNRIILAMNAIKGGTHAIKLVHDDTVAFSAMPDAGTGDEGGALTFSRELAFDGVSFRYTPEEPFVLSELSLAIRPGESIGIVGPSGAGKTTLVDLLAGLLPPTSGTITVDGQNIYGAAGQWRRNLGYVPQSIYLADDTLRRNIAFGRRDDEIDEARLANAIRLAQLEKIVAGLPQGVETPLGDRGARLSGGQRQRVGIARALYNDPAVLIFDEATSALDSETEHEITDAIHTLKGQKTLIVIAHRLSTVRECDRLIYLRNGAIDDIGSFADLFEKNTGFRKLVELGQLWAPANAPTSSPYSETSNA